MKWISIQLHFHKFCELRGCITITAAAAASTTEMNVRIGSSACFRFSKFIYLINYTLTLTHWQKWSEQKSTQKFLTFHAIKSDFLFHLHNQIKNNVRRQRVYLEQNTHQAKIHKTSHCWMLDGCVLGMMCQWFSSHNIKTKKKNSMKIRKMRHWVIALKKYHIHLYSLRWCSSHNSKIHNEHF